MVWTCDWTLQISKSSPILSSSFSDGPHTARPLYTSILHLLSWFSLLNSGVEELKLVNLNKDQVWALTQNRPQVTAKLSQWGGEGTSLSWESQKEEKLNNLSFTLTTKELLSVVKTSVHSCGEEESLKLHKFWPWLCVYWNNVSLSLKIFVF